MKYKWRIKNRWRRWVSCPAEMVEQQITKGYRYDKGFIAISHRAGYNGDDFVLNRMSIVFYLTRVPRIIQNIKRHKRSP